MQSANEAIAQALDGSLKLLQFFVHDFQPNEFLHRAVPKGNCAAWILGHLTITDRSILTRLGVTDLPDLPEDFEKRFGMDEASASAGDFGDVSIIMPELVKHREMLIAKVKSMSADEFAKPLEKPRPLFKNIGDMLLFIASHMSMHAGQITIIRRSLGRPPLV